MPPPFQELTRADFAKLLLRFPFERTVDAVHLHHSWRPRAREYRGHETLLLMWQTDRWRVGRNDIAQHVSIAPDGGIWTGRDWNRPPCSAAGHNGDAHRGPFMVMLIGDFNQPGEQISEEQYASAIDVVAQVQARFSLEPSALALHRELSTELSCPGTALERAKIITDVTDARQALASAGAGASPKPPAAERFRPFGEDAEAWYQFIVVCNQNRDQLGGEHDDGKGVEEDGR